MAYAVRASDRISNDKAKTTVNQVDGNGEPGLPAFIEDAWGLLERPNKGPRRGLSLRKIAQAAVKIAASENLGAVSMSRVAGDLDVSTMSLYRYLDSKEELLVLMVDAVFEKPPTAPERANESWRTGLSRWAWEQHDVLKEHTWVLRIPISGPPLTPNQIIWLERGLDCLRHTALAESEKLSVIMLLSGYIRNEATVSAEVAEAFMAASANATEAMATYGQMVRKLAGPDRFPALNSVIGAGVLDEPSPIDSEFVFGLDRVLDGIGVLIRKRAAESRGHPSQGRQ